ncbi:hypothetical protein ACIQMR_35505 [Streptomyces sp. NPDC091376]|uniref:hypothetical protein n=1 Tax=Streptomyces sp. NPDC091376 TaxID=3365994 RepID=UPI0038274D0F
MEFKLEDIDGGLGPFETVAVAAGSHSLGPDGSVMVEGAERAYLAPAQARELAAALLRAADEAERR